MTTIMEDIYLPSGARAATLFELDQSTGRIKATSTTPYYGTQIYGIKQLNLNVPEPRKITHTGNDRPLQIDWLPATEAMDGELTASATNLALEAKVSGVKVETVGTAKLVPIVTSQQGFEPQVALWFTRQTENISGLRRWENYVFSAAKVIYLPASMTDTTSDIRYKVAPAISARKIYGEAWTDVSNGATTAQLGQFATLEYTYLVGWKADGAENEFLFAVTKPANDSGAGVLGVWANDVLVAPADYTASADKITFDTPPAASAIITCIYGSVFALD